MVDKNHKNQYSMDIKWFIKLNHVSTVGQMRGYQCIKLSYIPYIQSNPRFFLDVIIAN